MDAILTSAVTVDLGDAVANGLAALAVIISVIALFTADARQGDANRISEYAATKADEANRIAREVRNITDSEVDRAKVRDLRSAAWTAKTAALEFSQWMSDIASDPDDSARRVYFGVTKYKGAMYALQYAASYRRDGAWIEIMSMTYGIINMMMTTYRWNHPERGLNSSLYSLYVDIDAEFKASIQNLSENPSYFLRDEELAEIWADHLDRIIQSQYHDNQLQVFNDI